MLDFLAPIDPLEITPLVLLVIVAAAVILSVPAITWRWFGLFTTLVHELGHAFGALATGRRVTGIRIHQNHAGSARSLGRGVLSTMVSGFFGYPAPALVGAALLWCAFAGYAGTALLVGTVIIAITLLFVRNLFGVLVVLASAAASAALWYFAEPQVQGYALLVIGVALLVGAVRGLVTVVSIHTVRRQELATSDAFILYRATRIPSPIWLLLFAAVIAASVWAAVLSILPAVGG